MKQILSKKHLCFLVLCLLFTGCTDTDYRKACEEHDFQKAYNIVLNLDENQEEAKRYVILQEAMYVLEQQGEDGIMKISVITKENKAYWLPAELLDFARISENSSLIEKLEKLEENCGNSLKIATPYISGVAHDYFEIVEENKYNPDDNNDFSIQVKLKKYIPAQLLNKWKKENDHTFSFGIELLDNNGSCIYSTTGCDEIEFSEIESMNIGGTHVLWMYLPDNENIGRARRFRITSSKF